MHTVKIIAGGLLLLALGLTAGRWLGGGQPGLGTAARYFIPVWLALAALNLWIGVNRAGYGLADEAPIFVVVFAVPAAVAAFLWWWFARG